MLDESAMTNAPKTSRGRPKGSTNYRARLARDIMERLKCDPLEALLRVVKNRRLPIALRIDAAKAAAPYCYPRLSTVFMAGKVDSDVNVTGFLAAAQHDPELTAAMEKLSLAMCAAERERKADDVIDAEFTTSESPLALPEPSDSQDA